jgi:hypothetical protein
MINLFLYFPVIFASKKSANLSLSIPPLSYKCQPKTPSLEIANIPVYFLNTYCDCVLIMHLLPNSL